MKSLAAFIFSGLLFAAPAVAQHSTSGGHSGGGFSGGHSGGVSGAHSGGFTGTHSGGGYSGGHSGNFGSGFHGNNWSPGKNGSVTGRGGYGNGRYRSNYPATVFVPYAYPVYGAGYYPTPSYPTTPSADYGDSGNGYAAPPPQSVQEDFGPGGGQPLPPPDDSQPEEQPNIQFYQAPAPTPAEAAMSEGRYYLIAYKDHSVYTALAYWMENGVLNYVTPQNVHNQISLDLLDLDLTKQLNSRRGLGFNIANQ